MSAYRDDRDALLAQCDALRSELAVAKDGSAELARIQAELETKLAELSASRISEAEQGIAAKRLTMRGVRLGFLLSALVASGVFAYFAMRDETPANQDVDINTPAGWFSHARAHCNPVEVTLYIKNNPPPGDEAGTPYKAACFALSGKFDEARHAIDSLPRSDRQRATEVVFLVVHPIADAGDNIAAGPAMEFVLEYTPNNYMALYHAGMSAYGKGDKKRAQRRLVKFLALYSVPNHFTNTAIATLKELEAPEKL